MMKSRFLFCFVMLFASFSLGAQELSVSGNVTSATDGYPITGAVVTVENKSTLYAITDLDGFYSIEGVSSDDVLVFSMMGYTTCTVVVGGRGVINVALEDETTLLEETVVIGYGTVKKKDLTGSVSSVNSDKLNQTVATSVDQMLGGKVSGVQITQNSGAPGAATSIRIRGANSINNTNEPLYIVDGVPYNTAGNEIAGFLWAGGTNGQSKVNPLSNISPSDIVSIDVLKDASATAIYGANGANGVIIITTKRGSEGRTNITYDGYVSAQVVSNELDLLNLSEYAEYQIGLCSDLGLTVNDIYKDPSLLGKGTDWQDEIFRTAWMHSHSVSVTGGTDRLQVAASGNYTSQDGVIIGSDFERFSGRINLDVKIFDWMKVGASLSFSHTTETVTNNDGTDGVVLQALTMQPNIPVYESDGGWAGPNSISGASQYNPVWLAEEKNNDYKRNRAMGNFYLSIDPIKDLNIRTEYAYDFQDNTNRCFVPTYSFGDYISSNINQILQRDDHLQYWMWKVYANYNKTFGSDHNFGAMVGYEMSRAQNTGSQLIKQNMSSDILTIITTDGDYVSNSGWEGEETMVSAFARVNYNYASRYYATATVRADASSKFGRNHKWGVFPSVALAWRISEEPFFESAKDAMNEFKLRLGYGQVGNSNISSFLYTSSMSAINTWEGTGYFMGNISNPDLKWEASEQYNVGIDMEFLNGRLAFTIDGYYKTTKDLLLQMSVPTYLGGTTTYWDIATPMVNMGQTSNRGFDLNITTRNIVHKNFSWTTNLVFSLNRNRVDAMNDDSQTISGAIDWYSGFQTATKIMVGQPMGVFYGYVVDGLFTGPEDILNSPVQVADASAGGNVNLVNKVTGVYAGDIKFKDLNGDGVIDEQDQTVIGDPNPDFTFGFTNTFNIGQFDINLALTGSVGGDVLNFSRYRTESMTTIWDNQTTAVLDRARYDADGYLISGTGYSKKYGYIVPRAVANDPNQNSRMSTRWIEDGSYLRISNLSIGYTFKPELLEKARIAQLRIYLNAQNLYTFTSYSGYDPEIGAYDQSALLQNIDRGRYPTPMSITFGVTIGF